MSDSGGCKRRASPPLGCVEPHAGLLNAPPATQLLFKVMRLEHFLSSLTGRYLHFNRVDTYVDDELDTKQLLKDLDSNARVKFERAPTFSAAEYYNQSRARTYACCFSTENSDHIWRRYGNGGSKGKVCLVVQFGLLRAMLNQMFETGNCALRYGELALHQIFSLNYGLIEYVDWEAHRLNVEYLPNPIQYAHLKDFKKYAEERELRISLSAMGIGQFVLNDGGPFKFPRSLQVGFDLPDAIGRGVVQQILHSPDCDLELLRCELGKLRIEQKVAVG